MDPISQEIIEAFLSGKLPEGAVPEELAKIKGLIDRANVAATHAELGGADRLVHAFRAAQGGALPTGGKDRVLTKLLTAKVGIAAASALALTGGAAAALTGVVPVSFNGNTTTTSSTVVPTNDSTTSTTEGTTSTTVSTDATSTTFAGESQGMASGANLFGECTAYMAITGGATTTTAGGAPATTSAPTSGPLASTNFKNLATLAASQGTDVATYCQVYLATHRPGNQPVVPAPGGSGPGNGHGNANGHGPSAGSSNGNDQGGPAQGSGNSANASGPGNGHGNGNGH